MMAVITVSRQYGSGGRDVAKLVAAKMGIPYVDEEIVRRAAALAGVSEDALADVDERRPTLLSFIADLLARYPTAAELGIPTVEVEPSMTQDSYRHFIEDVIRDIASKGSAVIVGRGSQVILKDQPGSVHVHLCAPYELRVRRVMERERLSHAEAEHLVRETDNNRSGYVKTYYKAHWQDPNLYALIINTGKLGIEGAADCIIGATKSMLGE